MESVRRAWTCPSWVLVLAGLAIGSSATFSAAERVQAADSPGQGVVGAPPRGSGQAETTPSDERGDIEASVYGGLAIDTFAAGELGRYLNPEASALLKERWIAGFDVALRLTKGPALGPQLWLYLETLHGVRSADVDCAKSPELPVCKPFQEILDDPTGRTLYILRNATSLEGFIGARFEPVTLHPNGKHPLRPYVNAQVGFLTIAGSGGDALENLNLGTGLTVVGGQFRASHLEVGIGRNQVFANQRSRLVIDGLLSWRMPGADSLRPFAQITIDSDLGAGPDAIQTYFGIDFDLGCLFRKGCSDNGSAPGTGGGRQKPAGDPPPRKGIEQTTGQ
jgi:hypothetical protein